MVSHANRRAALATGFALPAIDETVELEVAALAVGARKIAQGAATAFDGLGQGRTDLVGQPIAAAPRQPCRRGGRADARPKQALGGIDVANPDHHLSSNGSTPSLTSSG